MRFWLSWQEVVRNPSLNLLILAVSLLLFPAMSRAREQNPTPCKQIGSDCVGVVDINGDDVQWLARIVVKDGRDAWEPIEEADCPRESEAHGFEEHGHDPTYGDYVCQYKSAHEGAAPARKGGRIFRYVSTNKVLLLSDSALILSGLADVITSVRCQHMYPASCVETNAIVGRHPSDAATYGYKMGASVAMIIGNHWVNRSFGRWRHVYVPWTTSLVASNIYAAHHNIGVINTLEVARSRLMNEVPVQQTSFAETRKLNSTGPDSDFTTGFPRRPFSVVSLFKMPPTRLLAVSLPLEESMRPASALGRDKKAEPAFSWYKTSHPFPSFASIRAASHASLFELPATSPTFCGLALRRQ
jgi:hypothetical protein